MNDLHGQTWIDEQGCRCTVIGAILGEHVWVAREETHVTYHVRIADELRLELAGEAMIA